MTDLYFSTWHKRIALAQEQRIRNATKFAGGECHPPARKQSSQPATARPASEPLTVIDGGRR